MTAPQPLTAGRQPPLTWLIDMDGVLMHEGIAVPGAADFLDRLRSAGRRFLVVSGTLRIQLEGDQEVVLGPGQFYVVPRGVRHNPVADEEVEIVLIETVTTAHTGDVEHERTVPIADQLGDSAP